MGRSEDGSPSERPLGAAQQRGALIAFALTVLVVFGTLATAVFMSLPSNVVYGEDNHVRLGFNILASEQFPFFTKNPESDALGAYRVDRSGHVTNLLATPQTRARNLFGLSRTQRAQGPELAFLANHTRKQFRTCGGNPVTCVKRAQRQSPEKVKNRSPIPTVCGDVVLTDEKPVTYAYRKLVPYQHRVIKMIHLEVTCSSD